ncbi:fimbrial biogenesis chaperone [Proteus mirabilis]|uniref:fimbrial biogenesis chaperone n=1 Tax=Proteus mirabilis TaxID=584 RepID=UPI002DBA9092|nr:fimbria/pilus periplasmic chaperone [Proteus mirabilis]MEC3990572.1 fimbria/pilus periplasmic chaperone [Proteus mirabilis]MEC4039295.1 fimbria/pilus periplasmic chaperone [Proteus mirabilis]MEC4067457.1 fimbria/pilus periplasmic chaperone [Proteus mirabilis]MEC4097617.1 fimbria/pilus periplasmic chaperone [Proteus mirabilis]
MNSILTFSKIKLLFLMLLTLCVINQAYAAVSLGATRVIYFAGEKQVKLPVINNDEKRYLIQSWIENSEGKKDNSFVITPPLFSMQGKKENTLRIIDATNNKLPKDRETLFWLSVKSIPAVEKSLANENMLQLAIISKIKFFYRPKDLTISPDENYKKLQFKRNNDTLIIKNPTPYFITMTELELGGKKLENTMVPPFEDKSISIPTSAYGKLSFQTINYYGAITPKTIVDVR